MCTPQYPNDNTTINNGIYSFQAHNEFAMVKNDPSDGESHKSSWYNCNDGEGIHAVYGVEEEDYDSDDFDDDFFTDENFAEYMWMENIEEFDKAEMQRLEEEAMTKDCIEACSPRDDEQQADEDAIAADQDPSGLNM